MFKEFIKIFATEPEIRCFAPGRVNLIGEHTDYNGGMVLPCAIDLGVECIGGKRKKTRKVRFYSDEMAQEGMVEYDLDDLSAKGCWADYPMSMVRTMRAFGFGIEKGFDMMFRSTLPMGSGLSSSAAMEMASGFALKKMFRLSVSERTLAVMGQFAENHIIGVSCGIMDQFASAMGREDMAMLLDTDTLDCEFVPVGDKQIVVVNSGVKHSLAGSEYNKRRRECERAAGELGVSRLCTLGVGELESKSGLITDRTVLKRARHAVFENNRTRLASEALKNSDYITFGRLMNESHISLRDDYEVSCEELDLLAETAWGIDGVYGARMTGGGFGGCTVNLMEGDAVNKFERVISDAFGARYGRRPEMYFVRAGQGVREQKMIP